MDLPTTPSPSAAIACLDVDYRGPLGPAAAACVLFRDWPAREPLAEVVAITQDVAAYVPGQFFRRELPCLLAVLERVNRELKIPIATVVVDGYVWLADDKDAGLGAHLHEALGRAIPVIGVAKNRFHSSRMGRTLLRGRSANPLHITAIGIDVGDACANIAAMAGPHRLPTLLKRADRLCRDHGPPRP